MSIAVKPKLKNLVRTRLPTKHGGFVLHYYSNNIDNKEHVALVKDTVAGKRGVPVRIHSECFTGDVLGSRRCDCGDQLDMALQIIEDAGCGVLIYLRQEGRGIGLLKKLQAYNLQDEGLDTVDANIRLGHMPDEREYTLAALILHDLGLESIQLITNNPNKIDDLTKLGIIVEKRIPVEPGFHHDNLGYLKTKAEKLKHLLTFSNASPAHLPAELSFMQPFLEQLEATRNSSVNQLFITLSYAQSIDGSISKDAGTSLPLSDDASLTMTHVLRAHHDALLIGINTTLVDNPKLNVRHFQGEDPQPVILDCLLRFPENAAMLRASTKLPIIITTAQAPAEKKCRLQAKGIQVFEVEQTSEGHVDLNALLTLLPGLGLHTVMVEGGAEVINEFLVKQLVDYCVITITPKIIGGLKAVEHLCQPIVQILDCQYHKLGSDLILFGSVSRNES